MSHRGRLPNTCPVNAFGSGPRREWATGSGAERCTRCHLLAANTGVAVRSGVTPPADLRRKHSPGRAARAGRRRRRAGGTHRVAGVSVGAGRRGRRRGRCGASRVVRTRTVRLRLREARLGAREAPLPARDTKPPARETRLRLRGARLRRRALPRSPARRNRRHGVWSSRRGLHVRRPSPNADGCAPPRKAAGHSLEDRPAGMGSAGLACRDPSCGKRRAAPRCRYFGRSEGCVSGRGGSGRERGRAPRSRS
ncbi:LigA [Catenulispora acidiphila DSM 44928]|uniref:LigA n=1 Tax=Catenulispora acidiphila (strain DSM 44928 / JCM 14897 / NBRC 102108 / NRRL B-24433 / ID139908) TaxID=479433 RepID=C7QAQ3_CATAD|nr:LigA [Catenulispora acidiphila DSM 44928]